MLCKVSKWLVVVMLCLTLGFHWAFLQSVAWVGMMVNYSCQGSIKDAVAKTFDGRHPCPLCKLVREGRKSEKKSEAPQVVKKIDLFAARSPAFHFPPSSAPPVPFSLLPVARTDPPPHPPPRPFLG